jgi:hypothetical protein
MTPVHTVLDPLASPLRAHVLENRHPRITHVFQPVHAIANRPTLRYTLAGFPSGNLRAGRWWSCT